MSSPGSSPDERHFYSLVEDFFEVNTRCPHLIERILLYYPIMSSVLLNVKFRPNTQSREVSPEQYSTPAYESGSPPSYEEMVIYESELPRRVLTEPSLAQMIQLNSQSLPTNDDSEEPTPLLPSSRLAFKFIQTYLLKSTDSHLAYFASIRRNDRELTSRETELLHQVREFHLPPPSYFAATEDNPHSRLLHQIQSFKEFQRPVRSIYSDYPDLDLTSVVATSSAVILESVKSLPKGQRLIFTLENISILSGLVKNPILWDFLHDPVKFFEFDELEDVLVPSLNIPCETRQVRSTYIHHHWIVYHLSLPLYLRNTTLYPKCKIPNCVFNLKRKLLNCEQDKFDAFLRRCIKIFISEASLAVHIKEIAKAISDYPDKMFPVKEVPAPADVPNYWRTLAPYLSREDLTSIERLLQENDYELSSESNSETDTDDSSSSDDTSEYLGDD